MAELTLKTRLLNKMSEGTLADLRKGEINFYPAGDFLVMEVGGTDKPFAAKASDVAAWAKEAVKPSYTADEIDGLASYIAGKVQDTNTKYEFVINDNGELVITSKEIDGTTKTAATLDILTPAELNTTLANYVTETKLVEELSKYVTVANFNTFQETNTAAIADAKAEGTAAKTALNEYKTANDAALAGVKATAEAATTMAAVEAKGYAVATDVAGEITRVEGLVTAEASRADAAEKKALEDAKAYADGLAGNYDASGAAAAAEAAAKAYADGLAGNYDAAGSAAAAEAAAKTYADGIKSDLLGNSDVIEGTFDTLREINTWITTSGVDATDLSSAIAAEAKAREEADTALDTRIKAYEDVAATYATKSEVEAVSAVADAAQTADEVASAIDAKITALDLANTYDAKGAADAALEAAKAYADTLDHEDTTYTAGAGLKLDGTVFIIDTDLVFILDANA
jgi:hypothetical protein